MYNTERYRPNYAQQDRAADLPDAGLNRWTGSGCSGSERPAAQRLTPELREHIRPSFDEASRDEEHFPSTIDPRIYHVG